MGISHANAATCVCGCWKEIILEEPCWRDQMLAFVIANRGVQVEIRSGTQNFKAASQNTLSFLSSGVLNEEWILLCLSLCCLSSWEIVKQRRVCLV